MLQYILPRIPHVIQTIIMPHPFIELQILTHFIIVIITTNEGSCKAADKFVSMYSYLSIRRTIATSLPPGHKRLFAASNNFGIDSKLLKGYNNLVAIL